MTAKTVRQDAPRITAEEFLSDVPGDPHPIGSELIGWGGPGERPERPAPGHLWSVLRPAVPLDPARTVLVHRAGAFDDGLEVGPGEQLTGSLLPGLAVVIDDVFAE